MEWKVQRLLQIMFLRLVTIFHWIKNHRWFQIKLLRLEMIFHLTKHYLWLKMNLLYFKWFLIVWKSIVGSTINFCLKTFLREWKIILGTRLKLISLEIIFECMENNRWFSILKFRFYPFKIGNDFWRNKNHHWLYINFLRFLIQSKMYYNHKV